MPQFPFSYLKEAGSSFDYSAYSGYFMHQKSDTGSLETGGTQATNGEAVTDWEDQGPNSYDTASVTGSPLFDTTNSLNGYPALHFDGGDKMTNATSVDFMPFNSTVFIVAEYLEPTIAGIVVTGNNNLGRAWMNWSKTAGVSMPMKMARNFASRPTQTYTFGTGAVLQTLQWGPSGFGGGRVFQDGVLSTEGGTYTEATTDRQFAMGQQYSGGNGAKMYMYEMIIYHSYLSDSDRVEIQNELNTKYGL